MTESAPVLNERVLAFVAGKLVDPENRPVVRVVEGPGAETDGRTFEILTAPPTGPVAQPSLVIDAALAVHRQPPQLKGRVYGVSGLRDGETITTRSVPTYELDNGQKLRAEVPYRAEPGTPMALFRTCTR